jgi:hypothetical protein
MVTCVKVLLPTLAALVLGMAGCGGGGDGDSAPSTAGERNAVRQIKYCFEGAGALTAKPGDEIPELDRAPGGPELDDAKRILVAYWADTGDAAHVYYAPDAESARRAAEDASTDGAEWSGQVIVVPDGESPPSEDEFLLASDCLP